MRVWFTVLSALTLIGTASAQTPAKPDRVQIAPARAEAEVGQTLKFTATAFDAEQHQLDLTPTAWFASPFDSAAAVEPGTVTFYLPGIIRVGAIVGGKPGFATITV